MLYNISFFKILVYLFMYGGTESPSLCEGFSLVVVRGLLIVVTSLAVEHGL